MAQSEHPNLAGVSNALSEYTEAVIQATGGKSQESDMFSQMAMYLAALGGAYADDRHDLVRGLVYGDISPDHVAEELGWIDADGNELPE